MDEREAFLENYNQFLSAWGQGGTAGKILGLLMIHKSGKLSLDDLTVLAGRSKSTVHTAVKNMSKVGIIKQSVADETPSEGRYPHVYMFNSDFFEIALRKVDAIPAFKQLIREAHDFVYSDDPKDPRVEEFRKIIALYTWWEDKLRKNFKEWEQLEKSGEYQQYIDF